MNVVSPTHTSRNDEPLSTRDRTSLKFKPCKTRATRAVCGEKNIENLTDNFDAKIAAIDVTKPYQFIGLGYIDVTKSC